MDLKKGVKLDFEVKEALRDGFGRGIVESAEKDEDIVALTADLRGSTRLDKFSERFPERFIEAGICEQNMMSSAAGLSLAGKTPFVCSFAVFNPGRNWEQLRTSVCYSDHNVKLHGSHTGLSVGEDGASHQMLGDIALTRVLPNLVVLAPCDAEEARKVTIASAKMEGPVYIRTGRPEIPVFTSEDLPFRIGESQIFRRGEDVTIVACGNMVFKSLKAAERLESEGISAEVINCSTIKPLDEETVLSSARKTGKVVTAEEHSVIGGLGSAVSELLSREFPVPIRMVGVDDVFGESGPADKLLEKYGLTVEKVFEKCLELTG